MYSALAFEEDGELDEDHGVTCDRCGEEGLTWVDTGVDRWRLVTPSGLHFCKAHVSDFDNLPQ